MLARTGILLVLLTAFPLTRALASEELYRLRVSNKPGGLVQVSLDRGKTFGTVGRVTVPANARITGFAAASYIPRGTIAAAAVHSLRIKTGQRALGVGKGQMPLIFSIAPREFAKIPEGYGGHIPRSSGILTDIFAGESIFRNFAPFTGSRVYVERGHVLTMPPEDYTPVVRETFVVIVERPENQPSCVTIENRVGGRVISEFPGGTSEQIARVIRPVWGVGRYDSTSFTGVGAINTNHPGVITVSTAPVQPHGTHEGGQRETRGGFMIQPVRHAAEQHEEKPQVMVVASVTGSQSALEGAPPLFVGNIGLWRYADHPECSFRVDIRIDEGNWEPMPELVGKIDDAFKPRRLEEYYAKMGKPRHIETGVTAIRLVFPEYKYEVLARELRREVDDYTSRAIKSGVKPNSGSIGLAPRAPVSEHSVVDFYVDGSPIGTVGTYPYSLTWDSKKAADGLHWIQIESVPVSGEPTVESREILILNNRRPP